MSPSPTIRMILTPPPSPSLQWKPSTLTLSHSKNLLHAHPPQSLMDQPVALLSQTLHLPLNLELFSLTRVLTVSISDLFISSFCFLSSLDHSSKSRVNRSFFFNRLFFNKFSNLFLSVSNWNANNEGIFYASNFYNQIN